MTFRIAIGGDLTFTRVCDTRTVLPTVPTTSGETRMSPIEYIRTAYRLRTKLVPQLATVFALAIILTYHALTNQQLGWLLN